MDMDLDSALGRIAGQQPHPGLDGLEDRVLTHIAGQPARTTAAQTTFAGAAFALLLGVGSVTYPAPGAGARDAAFVGVPGPLAPSTLLLGAE
ncbi:hypothetical protein [Sphingomonas sp. VNH70]|uniref:hypothetical protein n=1 Tax=Sphingomonas silueang TaxID=3156617 RepID=UPI0032B370EF